MPQNQAVLYFFVDILNAQTFSQGLRVFVC
jgi:hypothetical protein